ncbi:MAG: ABC transporter ATP-binding protein [Ruegeria sp.]
MSIAHLLEDFSTTDPADTATLLMSDLELEEQRLAAFEKGYTAGWDDAIATDEQARARLSDMLSQNLEVAEITRQDALSQMQRALVPVFEAVSEQLLPGVVQAGLPLRLAPALQDIASQAISRPMVLSVPSGMAASVAPVVPQGNIDIVLEEDPGLSAGQARLHLDDGGVEIDLGSLAEDIRDAVAAFIFETQKDSPDD